MNLLRHLTNKDLTNKDLSNTFIRTVNIIKREQNGKGKERT